MLVVIYLWTFMITFNLSCFGSDMPWGKNKKPIISASPRLASTWKNKPTSYSLRGDPFWAMVQNWDITHDLQFRLLDVSGLNVNIITTHSKRGVCNRCALRRVEIESGKISALNWNPSAAAGLKLWREIEIIIPSVTLPAILSCNPWYIKPASFQAEFQLLLWLWWSWKAESHSITCSFCLFRQLPVEEVVIWNLQNSNCQTQTGAET